MVVGWLQRSYRAAYALITWSVIPHSLIRLPGWFLVFNHALKGFQQSDHAQFLDSPGGY
jgi:hypothetical protein